MSYENPRIAELKKIREYARIKATIGRGVTVFSTGMYIALLEKLINGDTADLALTGGVFGALISMSFLDTQKQKKRIAKLDEQLDMLEDIQETNRKNAHI